MRVLIVDDDEMALAILENMFATAGYEVETASDGRQALKILRRGQCRLVVSDWDMPKMNGLELCRAIRAGRVCGYVYFVLVSAHDTPQLRKDGLAAGADAFATKPFDPAQLTDHLRRGQRKVLSAECGAMSAEC
jgi:DNA-binding response OmpR family regulator